MATDIVVSDLTNSTGVTNGVADGTGVFDKLMNTVNSYLDDQYTRGRLKGTDYANVLLGSIQSVVAQSMQYLLQEQLTEAQVDDVRKGIELKEKQLEIAEIDRLTKLYEKDSILPEQLAKLSAETTLIEQKLIGRKQ